MAHLSVDTDVRVPTRDGTLLATTVVRPFGPGAWPVVLMRTPYDRRSYASLTLQVHAFALAESGYAVALQDVRGQNESTGVFEPFVNEARDGLDTIDWLASQTWCDGSIGLAGASYNAFTQLAVAVENPPGLMCWVPALAPSDVRTSWIRRGGVLDLGFHLAWGLGSIASQDRRTEDPQQLLQAFSRPTETARRGPENQPEMQSTPAGKWFFDWVDSDDPYHGDPRVPGPDLISKASAPALVIGGWFDVFSTGSVELISILRQSEAGTHHRLVMGPWDHSGLPLGRRSGDRDFGLNALADLHQLQLAWFDRNLKGIDDEGLMDRIFVTGRDSWLDIDWPPPTTELSLGIGDELRPIGDHGHVLESDVETPPTPTVGGAVFPWEPSIRPGAYDQSRRRARSDVLALESDPLPTRVLVAGTPQLTLRVDSEPGESVVLVTLVEVGASGVAWNVSDGIGRVDPSTGLVSVELGPAAHEFSDGSCIGVDIAFSAEARIAPARPGRRAIDMSVGSLRLPLIDQ